MASFFHVAPQEEKRKALPNRKRRMQKVNVAKHSSKMPKPNVVKQTKVKTNGNRKSTQIKPHHNNRFDL